MTTNVNYAIGDKLRYKYTKKVVTIESVNENGAKLKFPDGSSAEFPWRWVIRDFDRAEVQ